MARSYLYFNAFIYALFAIWCSLAPEQTAHAQGYAALTASGMSEYLVVYGGMEFGFAALFWHWARSDPRTGLLFALGLYAPIVLWRAVSVLRYGPIAANTLAVAALEAVLLVIAIVLWRRSAQKGSH
jgi:hypothetical protein